MFEILRQQNQFHEGSYYKIVACDSERGMGMEMGMCIGMWRRLGLGMDWAGHSNQDCIHLQCCGRGGHLRPQTPPTILINLMFDSNLMK